MQELKTKIIKILKTKYPDYTDIEINEMLEDYGEMIILKTMGKTFELLDSDESRKKVGELMDQDKSEEAFMFALEKGVDMPEIFQQVSKEVVLEIFGN